MLPWVKRIMAQLLAGEDRRRPAAPGSRTTGAGSQRPEGRRDAGRAAAPAGVPVDAVHPRGARGAGEHQHGAPGQHRDLVARKRVAGVGAHGAAAELHRPVVRQRERRHDRPEIGVVGVHADALAGAVLVDDALHGESAAEALPEPVRHDLGPARERRGGDRAGRAAVVVAPAVMLHAPAQLGHPGRLGDALEDAGLLGRGDEVGDDDRPLGEDARGVAGHALSPCTGERPAHASLLLRRRRRTGGPSRGDSRPSAKGGPARMRRPQSGGRKRRDDGGSLERNPGAVVGVRRSGGAGVARRGRVGLRRRAVAVRLVQELDASAGDEQDLGREPVAVLAGLRPAPGLQLAVDVDQPALGGVLLEHVDQPVLEGHDAVPLGLVDLVAGLPVDVALVGRDAQIGDAAAAHELVDGDVGAEAADQLDPVESECHGVSPSWTG